MPFFGLTQNLKKANQDFSTLNYEDAIYRYEKQLTKKKEGSQNVTLLQNLANSYYAIQKYDNAKGYYMNLYTLQGNNMNEKEFIRLVSSLRSVGNNDQADKIFDTYYSSDKEKLKIKEYQKSKLEGLESEYSRVVNLSINSPFADFGASINGKVAVFSSARSDGKTGYLNLYKANRNPNNGELSSAELFLENLNSDYHDATFTFSRAGNEVFFSRNYLSKKGKLDAENNHNSHVMIMRGTIVGDKITNVVPCGFNSKEYNCSHPFVTADGKHILFASDMPGGFGGSDIYIAELYNDGSTGEPVNLGPMINTAGAEMYPSVSGDTLFFSSDFHYGFGGLDVFSSIMKGETNYSVPENLGKPINSSKDDFSFIRVHERTGYFSSNRDGGKGGDDIYWYDMVDLITEINYNGIVLTKGDDAPIPNAKIKVHDIFGDLVAEYESNEDGEYSLVLPLDSQFKVIYSKVNYSTEEEMVYTPKKAEDSDGNNVRLTSFASLVEKDENEVEKIRVNPIYFDLDMAEITDKAIEELNKIEYAMKTFSNIRIKIEAHTDSRGKDKYNLELSDKRAKSTRDYLISVGIDPERILSAIGYGETRLLNKCSNGVKCTDEEHAVNRRSDFIIVEK